MQAKYVAWQRQRKYALPDEELRALKQQLAFHNRDRRQIDDDGEVTDRIRGALTLNDDFISTHFRLAPKCFASFPINVRIRILDYVSVVDTPQMQDLQAMEDIAGTDDVSILHATLRPTDVFGLPVAVSAGSSTPSSVLEDVHPVLKILAHIDSEVRSVSARLFANCAATAANVGIRSLYGGSGRLRTSLPTQTQPHPSSSTTAAFQNLAVAALRHSRAACRESSLLPLQSSAKHSFFQLDVIVGATRRIKDLLRKQRMVAERILSWVLFREKTLDTPCQQLRQTVRDDFAAWDDVFSQWFAAAAGQAERDASVLGSVGLMLFRLGQEELQAYRRRVPAVEYLGSPTLTLDDARNLYWEVDKQRRDIRSEMTETYMETLTFRQAMNLGFTEIPWVRGYSWEERVSGAEDDLPDDVASVSYTAGDTAAHGARAVVVASSSGNASPEKTGARSLCSVTRSERVQQLLGVLGVDDSMKRQMEELELERVQLEEAAEAQRRRAFLVAADGMSQRLWMSTNTFRPRWEHPFRGCEICNQTPIDHVGLKRENAAVSSDIVLCNRCFVDLYDEEASSGIPNRMYTWFRVADLIQSGATAVE